MDAPTDSIRALVGRYNLGYYFNPGGCEFFSCANESIPHCQTSEYGDEEDRDKLKSWCAQHEDNLLKPREDSYLWYSEGQWPVRVIKGRYFHRCVISCQIEGEGGIPQDWEQEFVDIEELEDGSGWRLLIDAKEPTVGVTIQPKTPEERAYWQSRLFMDKP